MKMAINAKMMCFCVMPLKHVQGVMGLVNHPRIPKLWAIAHKNGRKRKNDEFVVMPPKHVLSVMDLVNHSRTQKLCVIAQENGPKMQKQRVFLSRHLKMY
jgi:hypothetical protein